MSTRILSKRHREEAGKLREYYLSIIDRNDVNNTILKLKNQGYSVNITDKKDKNNMKFDVKNNRCEFGLNIRNGKIYLGRTVTFKLDILQSDIETIQSLNNLPYRFINVNGNVYIKNYDWTKESKIKQ